MTLEEINELEKELDKLFKETKEKIQRIKEENKETKQHKSLSDYRYYEKPKYFEEYKSITGSNGLYVDKFTDHELHQGKLEIGNMYSADTPNELLEREIKKRQLWFELEKHLKEKGCLATDEDWKYRCADKYCVDYDLSDESFYIEVGTVIKCNNIYSTDEEKLKDYMNTLTKEDVKIMFDVE